MIISADGNVFSSIISENEALITNIIIRGWTTNKTKSFCFGIPIT